MEQKPFGEIEVMNNFRGFALAQCSLVKSIFDSPIDEKSQRLKVVIGSTLQTCMGIIELSNKPEFFYSEMVMLMRAFIEKVINFCYLQICDDDEFERYFKHSFQKAYRKLDREMSVGEKKVGIKFMGNIDFSKNPGLQEAIDEFTGPKGNEKTHWTPVTIQGRIKLISERSSVDIEHFMLNTLWVYEDASEALHGTFYGCTFHTGAYEPNLDRKDTNAVMRGIQQKITLLFLHTGSMFHEVIKLLSTKNDLESIIGYSNKNIEGATELLKYALKVKDTETDEQTTK